MNLDCQLEYQDRAILAQTVATPGYKVLHTIMQHEANKFIIALINADAADDQEVIARHRLAKAAAQFFTAVTNRVSEEVLYYTAAPRPNDKPIDSTEGNIDIGEVADEQEPNGGLEFE